MTTPKSEHQSAKFPYLKGPYLGQRPLGMMPELFAPGIISTCAQHGSAYFSPGGREAYFSRMLPSVVCAGLTPGFAPDGRTVLFSTWDLWRMFKISSGWTAPEKLGPSINFQKRQDTPYAAANGTLYFCSMFGNRDGISPECGLRSCKRRIRPRQVVFLTRPRPVRSQ